MNIERDEALRMADALHHIAVGANTGGISFPRAAVADRIVTDQRVDIGALGRLVEEANRNRSVFFWPVNALLEALAEPRPVAADVAPVQLDIEPEPAPEPEPEAEAAPEPEKPAKKSGK